MSLLRIVAGVVLGYAVMVLLITAVQEGWFGGVAWGKSPPAELAIAGLFTALSAAVGGIAATAITRRWGRIAAVIMSCLVAVETTVLLATGKLTGPLWFDLTASASLVVAILIGAEAFLRLKKRPERARAA